jgi:hypothetical protein
MLTIGRLREIISDLPDDMEVYLTTSTPREIAEVTIERVGTPVKQKTNYIPFAVESSWDQFPVIPSTIRTILLFDSTDWKKHGLDFKSLI